MSSPRPRRAAATVLLVLAATLTAGCGSSTSEAPVQVRQASYVASLHERLPASVRDDGVLRIGTDASYAPMSSFGPDGRTIVGTEPDLAAEIGRVLGVEVELVHTDFTDLLPAVATGELDLAMSAMTDTAARAERVDFVNYFSAGTSILVQRGNPAGITQIDHLCGEVVAVEEGTTQVDLLARAQRRCGEDRITVQTYPTNTDALVELRTGRAAAVLNDLPPAVHLVTDARTQSSYQLASTTTYEPGLYGIAVSKRRSGLRDAVQAACEKLLAGGLYDDVLERWGVQDGAIDRISINSDRDPSR